ncbi:hypothetical protein [Sphingorhabdus sp. 109]|uniref:hypothetical protein n=1 Tax=Sphingorhabdus sp. 109 TaxID=2653173 RepID=UPI001357CFE5|nr:hypothetical protein [Sphingorhabdus sp. 109]
MTRNIADLRRRSFTITPAIQYGGASRSDPEIARRTAWCCTHRAVGKTAKQATDLSANTDIINQIPESWLAGIGHNFSITSIFQCSEYLIEVSPDRQSGNAQAMAVFG